MGFEEAIASTGFNQILYDILCKFLSELRPYPEDPTTPDNINAVLRSVVVQYCAKNPLERTVWWMESSKTNAHPFSTEDVDFFAMSWQDRLVVLRQLIDWQLAYSNVKEIIDIAWEVKYQRKKKKTNKTLAAEFAPPDEDDPMSINNLRMVAIGQDSSRIRYWVVDDSPRVWASPNPWRMNCPMSVVATTLDEYVALVKKIRDTAPAVAEGSKVKLSKPQQAHMELLPALEARHGAVDAYVKRIKDVKHQRQEEKEEDELASVIAMVEEERKSLEIGSRTRSRATARKSEEPNEIDVSEDDLKPGPSTSKRKAKGRASASKKAPGKKRKREESPSPSDPNADAPQVVDEPASEEVPAKPAAKGKAAAASGRRKSGRDAEAKIFEEVEDDTPQEQEEVASTPKAKSAMKSKSGSRASLDEEETAPPAETESMLEDQPHATASEAGAREKLPLSESGDTTPVNPSHILSALGPQSPVMKAGWSSDLKTTPQPSPVKTVSPVSAA
ncbi:hypothetical protein FRC01_005738 [Tulasnella sp. 417]|nr:hypothetical protein FRC01_005738 [Tulasnella sp. 417]